MYAEISLCNDLAHGLPVSFAQLLFGLFSEPLDIRNWHLLNVVFGTWNENSYREHETEKKVFHISSTISLQFHQQT
jgi:hypothetical protein